MPVDDEAPKVDRYAWPGVEEEALAVTCARIARHLVLAHPRTVGFLPIGGARAVRGRKAARLAPLLSRVAAALVGFVSDDIGIVDTWRTWAPTREAGKDEAGPSSRIREIQPRILEVMPPGCKDAAAAASALRNTLAILRRSVSIVLVNLGGYAESGIAPATLSLVDGVVMVVPARRTRKAEVASLVEHLPAAKQLGAILVG